MSATRGAIDPCRLLILPTPGLYTSVAQMPAQRIGTDTEKRLPATTLAQYAMFDAAKSNAILTDRNASQRALSIVVSEV